MGIVEAEPMTVMQYGTGARLAARLALGSLIALLTASGCKSDRPVSQPPQVVANPTAPISASAERGPVRATVTVSAPEAKVAEKLRVTLVVQAEKEVELTLPFIGSEWEDWRVSDVQLDRGPAAENESTQQQKLSFDVMSLRTGDQKIPALVIKFVDRRNLPSPDANIPAANLNESTVMVEAESNELRLDPIPVRVISVLEANADPTQYRDAKGLADINVPKPWSFWAMAAVVGVVALAAAGAAVVYVRRNWQRSVRMAKVLPPHEWAAQQIDKLVVERLVELGRFEPFYVRLSGIVRTYLEIRFGLMAPERTTEEFLRDARRSAVLTLDHQELLSRFLAASDMVKFAQYQPAATEVERAIQSARDFIRETPLVHEGPGEVGREAAA